jgi:N-acyl-D-amino-acid deacylase
MQLAIAKIKAARASGEQVTADIYPYINNGLGIAALIHPRHFGSGHQRLLEKLDDSALRSEIRNEMETTSGWENWFSHVGHDWDKIVVGQTSDTTYAPLAGQSLAQMAKAKNADPWNVFFQLVRAGAFVLPESMSEENKLQAIREEFVSFCTDVGPSSSIIASHPRAFGSFPRLLSHYVRDLGAISLERAVAQASAAGANAIMAYDRGRIAPGLAADIIVFDYEKIADKATFARPAEPSVGMKHVIVNGSIVLDDGRLTAQRPGRVLRGPGYRVGAE